MSEHVYFLWVYHEGKLFSLVWVSAIKFQISPGLKRGEFFRIVIKPHIHCERNSALWTEIFDGD